MRELLTSGRSTSSETRVTSPDGQFDAVMVQQDDGAGAMGGFEYYVYIVRKGSQVQKVRARSIFDASTLSGDSLVWESPHLLDIKYNKAEIESFRNIWALDQVESVPDFDHDDFVEVRLVPSSEYSLLSPSGEFRSQ